MNFFFEVLVLTTNRDYTLIHTEFDIISHSAFIIFNIISSRHFYHSTLCPVWRLLDSTLFPVDVFYFSMFCPIQRLLPSFLCPFVVDYHMLFCPFDVFLPFDICPIDLLSHSMFFTVSVFYCDILSVNPYKVSHLNKTGVVMSRNSEQLPLQLGPSDRQNCVEVVRRLPHSNHCIG